MVEVWSLGNSHCHRFPTRKVRREAFLVQNGQKHSRTETPLGYGLQIVGRQTSCSSLKRWGYQMNWNVQKTSVCLLYLKTQ